MRAHGERTCIHPKEWGRGLIPVTIEDIARMSGVSRGTVDRVVHDRGGALFRNLRAGQGNVSLRLRSFGVWAGDLICLVVLY